MSRYNEVYAEIYLDNKWHSLNPIIKDENSGIYNIKPIITGQSYLTPFFNFACDNCIQIGIPDDLSKEVYELLNPDKIISNFGKEASYKDVYYNYYSVIDYDILHNVVKDCNKSQFRGFVDEHDIKLYEENNEYEISNYYALESFVLLSSKERNRLRYYEWDDHSYGSLYPICKDIIQTIETLKNYFLEYYPDTKCLSYRIYKIRLIVYGS